MTDTDKWKKPFIKSLPIEYKCFWFFILDDCDHAGIWQVDQEVAELRLGIKLSLEKARGLFNDKVVAFDNGTKWFIPDFINFQYGGLNEKNKLFNSISQVLNRYNLLGHLSPIYGVKEKEQEKEKDIDSKIGGMGERPNQYPTAESFNYPLPEITAGSVVQMVKYSQGADITPEQVNELWEAFKIQNLTGKKFYSDKSDVFSHFINWSKIQKNAKSYSHSAGRKSNHRPNADEARRELISRRTGN